MRPIAVVAVCLLAVLAGCSGSLGAEATDREPYGVDERVEVVDDSAGIGEDGTVDVAALAEAHREAAASRSYTYRTERLIVDTNGSVVNSFELYVERDPMFRGVFSAEHEERVYVYAPGHEKVEERWADGDGALTRTERPDGSESYVEGGYVGPVGDRPTHLFEALSIAEETTVRSVDEGYLIEGHGVEDGSTFEVGQEYKVEVVVREDGLLAEYRVEGVVDGPDGRFQHVDNGTYTDVDGTTPERPDWVGEYDGG